MKRKPVLLVFVSMALSSACAQTGGRRAALESLVNAEISFAKTSVTKGMRAAFLAYLADSALVFHPHPTNGPAAYRNRPDTPMTLNWRPIYADVANSGNWGYTTGPWEITDNGPQKRPPAYGNFFSVWQKQADGNWKVIIDIGIANAEPKNLPQGWQAAATVNLPARTYSAAEIARAKAALLQRDKTFSETAGAQGLAAAYQSYLSEEARVLRIGHFPLTEKNAIYAKLTERQGATSWQPLRVEMAQSLDLAYTMGAYQFKPAEQTNAIEKVIMFAFGKNSRT